MIKPESYEKKWLDYHRGRPGYERINPPVTEKMIHALSLVEQLALQGLDFVFKGGTSLILILNDAGRFSIDIDIVTQASREEIERVLAEICHHPPFYRFEFNAKRSYKGGVPKAHYHVYFTSALSGKEDHILLDILYEKHAYPSLLSVPLKTPWLLTHGEDVLVRVPSAASIAGDKLTAFAPTTTGILFGKEKQVDIVKQLHDISNLYGRIESVGIFMQAFNETVEKEIRYRNGALTSTDVTSDIRRTALLISRRERNTMDPYKKWFEEIRTGLQAFKAYQTNTPFRIEEAIIASAKAALLATKIETGNTDPLPHFDKGMTKSDFLIQLPSYKELNKLHLEPLFYWHHALKLLPFSP